MLERFILSTRSRQRALGVGVVLLVAGFGISLGLQGWNSRGMNFDHVSFIDGAHVLLSKGTLPDRGDVSSYGSFATPGTAWLMVPGMLVFVDPRLFELVGSTTLYLGTLMGVFLLARMCFGAWCASLSVLLYGLSRSGLFYAGSLWPIGHPFFYVWMIYFCIHWVQRNNSTYLATALVTWAVGMYVDMVIAPAVFVFPALWLLYRPPLRVRPLVIAGVIGFATWFPYLQFQVERNFADFKSLVFRQRILPANYKDSWCVPTRALQKWTETSTGSNSTSNLNMQAISDTSSQTPGFPAWYRNLLENASSRVKLIMEGSVSNFDKMTSIPRAGSALLLLAVLSLAVMTLLPFAAVAENRHSQAFSVYWLAWFASLLLLSAVLANEFVIGRLLSLDGTLEASTISGIRRVQIVLIISAIALFLFRNKVAGFLSQLTIRKPVGTYFAGRPEKSTLFAVGVVVPWLALLLVAEPGRPDRYWWLWPLQVIVLVASVTYLPAHFKLSRSVASIGQICLTLSLLAHPALASPLQAWIKTGWSGPPGEKVQVVDYLANQILSEGKDKAALGYQTFTYAFSAIYHVVDPRYKVGAEFDMLFKYRYGVLNTNRCAEGVSPADEYRIVQTRPNQPKSAEDFFNEPAEEYFDVTLPRTFHMLRQFGDYQVYKRTDSFQG